MENSNLENSNNQINQQLGQQELPNATAILVLGIISIVGCFSIIVGSITGIIALILIHKAKKLINQNLTTYTTSSINNIKVGQVCAIIGICLSVLYFVLLAIFSLLLLDIIN